MTEAEWLACADPDPLLRWLQKSKRRRPTARKLGLFACACARRLGDLVAAPVTAGGLDLAERMAEGTFTQDEYRSFLQQALGGAPRDLFTHVALFAVRVTIGLSGTSPEGSARSVAAAL